MLLTDSPSLCSCMLNTFFPRRNFILVSCHLPTTADINQRFYGSLRCGTNGEKEQVAICFRPPLVLFRLPVPVCGESDTSPWVTKRHQTTTLWCRTVGETYIQAPYMCMCSNDICQRNGCSLKNQQHALAEKKVV